MRPKHRPRADVVVVEGDWDSPSLVHMFSLTSDHDSHANKLHELARGLRSYLSGAGVDRVMVRRADVNRRASASQEAPKVRLLAEGALAAAAREKVEDVHVLTGKELAGRTTAGKKADLDARADAKLPDSDKEAAAAALAGLV